MTSDDKCREMFEAWVHENTSWRCGDPRDAGPLNAAWVAWLSAWTARGEADAEANSNELLVKVKPGRLSPSPYEFRGDE